MPITKTERAVIRIEERLDRIFDQFESQKIKVDHTHKTVFENGLSSQVKEIHGWMKEQKAAAVKIDGEMRILFFKNKNELRVALIGGLFLIVNTMTTGVVTYFLTR